MPSQGSLLRHILKTLFVVPHAIIVRVRASRVLARKMMTAGTDQPHRLVEISPPLLVPDAPGHVASHVRTCVITMDAGRG